MVQAPHHLKPSYKQVHSRSMEQQEAGKRYENYVLQWTERRHAISLKDNVGCKSPQGTHLHFHPVNALVKKNDHRDFLGCLAPYDQRTEAQYTSQRDSSCRFERFWRYQRILAEDLTFLSTLGLY